MINRASENAESRPRRQGHQQHHAPDAHVHHTRTLRHQLAGRRKQQRNGKMISAVSRDLILPMTYERHRCRVSGCQRKTNEPAGSEMTKTLKDVSAAAGLSLITVSRALRRPESVQESTRQKVLQAIKDIGYVPNLTARSLVSSRSKLVGVVIPSVSSSLIADLVQGAADVLQQEDLHVLLGVSQSSPELEADAVRTIIGRQADAIILAGLALSEESRTLLRNYGRPVVETSTISPKAIDMAVGFDGYKAARDMTRYLILKGYREIAVVGGQVETSVEGIERLQAFRDAMAEAGRPVRPEFVLSLPRPMTLESGRDAIDRLMSGEVKPDAVFFQVEIPAQGAVLACLSKGIAIPGTVAIAGFGGMTLSSILPTPLTTVREKVREIGEQAARLVVDRLKGIDPPERIVDLGYELLLRGSA
jgi:LacI family gluconate utilization system Gnt-I transcriptional repressor